MKKLLTLLAALFLVFTVAACRDEDEPADENPPMFFGVSDVVVYVGDEFDPMEGVTATDDVDGDVTDQIEITGEYDLENPGTYTLTYTVVDEAGNEAEETREITVRLAPESELHITNGDFSEPLENGWTHWSGEGGASTAEIIDGEAVLDIESIGSQWWSTQFSQPDLRLPQGTLYELRFDARGSEEGEMVVKLENPQYYGYIDTVVELTTEMTTYTIEVFFPDPTIDDGKLIFGAGNVSTHPEGTTAPPETIHINNVAFIELELGEDTTPPEIHGAYDRVIAIGEHFDPLEGIEVTDDRDFDLTVDDIEIDGFVDNTEAGDYVLTYTVADASGNETVVERTITVTEDIPPSTWIVENGDFSEDQSEPYPQPAEEGWGWHGGADFDVKISDGIATIDIRTLDSVAHGVQFYQQNRVIEQGRMYRITFDAKADIPRSILVALEEGWSRRFDHVVDITDEWETYTIEFEHVLPGYSNGKFAFFMGLVDENSVPTRVYLDNVHVETIGSIRNNTDPVLRGVEDTVHMKGESFDPLRGVRVYDLHDDDLDVDDIDVTGEWDINEVGDYTIVYTVSDKDGNETVVERTIHVREASDMNESSLQLVNPDFSEDQDEPYPQPAEEGWGWHGGGTFDIDIADGVATIDITDIGTVFHGVQFYQQNLVAETGATYKVTFDARADEARDLMVSLEMGTSIQYSEDVMLDTDWATYEVFIRVPRFGFTNGKFAFFAGELSEDSIPTVVQIDNVDITQVGHAVNETDPIITGATDIEVEKGSDNDEFTGLRVFDLYDKTLTVDDITLSGDSFDIDTVGTYTITYTLTDRDGNETMVERTITVIEPEEEEE